jgi:tetratricopeptide (TPR) repeat protein
MRVINSGIVACVLLGGCATERSALQRSRDFFDQGNFFQAYVVLEDARDPTTLDEELEGEIRRVRLFYLLNRGQQLVFLDREGEAVEEFQKALVLEPGNPPALEWIAKATGKLAVRAINEGDEARISGQLELALEKYDEALNYVPGHEQALAGQRRVAVAFENSSRRAKDEHMQGVRKMHDRRYREVWRHEVNALSHDPSHEDAQRLHERVLGVLAEEQFDRARQVEEDRKFGAALLEYTMVQELVPDFPGVQEHIDHMHREVDADELVRDSDMVMRRAQYEADENISRELFAEARRLLDEAFELSISNQATISEQMVIAREKEFETRYYAAMDLELQYQYEGALEAFGAIDAEWPDGFMDVKARINDLEESIALAEEDFVTGQEAEKAGDIPAAIEAYRHALLYYPTYKGLDEKIKALSSGAPVIRG